MQELYDTISQHPVVQDWNADMVDWTCYPVEGEPTIRDRRIMLDMIAGLIPTGVLAGATVMLYMIGTETDEKLAAFSSVAGSTASYAYW